MGVCTGEDDVSLDLGVHDLSDDVLVGEADDEAVFWAVVLVLRLSHQSLAGIVVRLAFPVYQKGGFERC